MVIDYDKAHELYQNGRSAMDHGDYPKAIELFRHSNQICPHFKTLELMGECLLKTDNPPEAVLALAAAAGLGEKPFRARFLLAQALMRLGEETDAVDQLKKAVVLKPDYKAAKELLKTLKDG